jgi:flagellar hook protein FlgE
MAGGQIIPQYSQNARIYDSLGTGHDLKIGFIKTGNNTWATEIYAANTADVSPIYANGLLASGTIIFNGDGTLRSVSSSLASSINILWSNGSQQSDINLSWGTPGEPFGTVGALAIGKTDGMSQFDASYRFNFVNQNGAAVGALTNVTIDSSGFVIANYNNGESQKLYRIPIADFTNTDALQAISGNVFQQTTDSGEASLRRAGEGGAGKLQPSALEASTVDLSTELTDMIIAQRAYQAVAKVITTAGALLDDLNQAVRS